ncbi:MAG: SusC/RagA family TonB-linked outer membrane protein [Dysgonamonadaceae bacterium]|jgi:TonB-linked SusC/RagA family outer membrane protein|nr:SusC/RagA family TonB-linked outer membrane protein [Dysgonamonadaceae bacterium]
MKRLIIQICFLSGLLLALSFTHLSAQERALIRGTVISAQDKLPLIQATIAEVNKDNRVVSSTVTNIDGNFSLHVTDTKNRLEISYLGYKRKVIPIGSNTTVKVTLEEDNQMLGEVTITASPKRTVGTLPIDHRDISMSIVHLDASEIADLHAASVDEMIQGRLAGVDIVANAGDPGSGMAIRIRGITSFSGNNQPLIVVDGIPLETSISSDFDFGTATEEEFSQLLNIAPSDIKDITVLKDAAATAIWGSKAANGVLQITTQRGTISPPKVSFRATTSYYPTPPHIPTLSGSEYSTLILEEHLNGGSILDPLVYPYFAYDPNNPEFFYNYSQNTDWVDAVSQDASAQDYYLSVRGGSPKVRYAFSAGYYDQVGNTIGTGLQRINTRLNLDYYVSDHLRFSADIAYTHSNIQKNYVPDNDKENADIRSHAYIKMPNQSIYYINEFGIQTPTYFTPVNNPQGSYPKVFNPVAMAREGRYDILSETILPKLSIQYQPNLVWRYTFDISFQTLNEKKNKFLPQSATGLPWSNPQTNQATESDGEGFTIHTFNKLYFTPEFADANIHRFIGVAGVHSFENSGYSYTALSSNLANPKLQDTSIESRVYPNGNGTSPSSRERTIETFLNLNYTFLDRYTIFGNLNYNGSSRFGKNYRFGLFPALSGRYRISSEPFLKRIKWLDDFSLRASYGIVGKAPSKNYLFYNNYATYGWSYLGNNATYPQNLELSELRWEKSVQQNYGINFVALDYKLNLEVDYFVKTTEDQFTEKVKIPTSSGFSTMSMNDGTLENRGWEINLNYTPIRTRDLNINFAFNLARYENVIKDVNEYAELYSGDWSKSGSYLSRILLNQPIGSFYGYKYDGVYVNATQTIAQDRNGNPVYTVDEQGKATPVLMQFGYPTIAYVFQPGDARYQDLNHDGNINYQDIVYLGDYNPLFYGGLTPSIKYKQFSLNTVFHFRYGNDIINMTRMKMESMYNFDNQSKSVLKRWRHEYANPEDAPADLLPRALYGSDNYNWLASDRFIEDGSFIRWKSVTFKYNFQKEWLTKYHLSELYMYLTVNNLYVWTNYTGQDPEVSIGGSTPGQDYSFAPIPRSYTFGLNITF